MNSSFRRYEILLPLQSSDGSPIPAEQIGDVVLQLRQQFSAVSSETQIIQGHWQHQGVIYRDDLVRLFVDVPDTEAAREFFVVLKDQLKERFGQIDIWMTSHPIDVI